MICVKVYIPADWFDRNLGKYLDAFRYQVQQLCKVMIWQLHLGLDQYSGHCLYIRLLWRKIVKAEESQIGICVIRSILDLSSKSVYSDIRRQSRTFAKVLPRDQT